MRRFFPNIDADIDDELRFHLESRIADYIAAGHSPDDARRLATERFGDHREIHGSLRRHDVRKLQQQRRAETMDELVQDVRYAARKLRLAPGFAIGVVAILALGIGANTAIYSAVDAALLRPLPFADPERIVALHEVNLPSDRRGVTGREFPKHSPDLADVAALTDVFSHVAAYANGGLNLVGGDSPMRAGVTYVTTDFFTLLGRAPALGRTFTAEETSLDGPRAIILSDAAWRTQFGADPKVIGRRVSLSGVPHEIVGVMPPSFRFPSRTDLWVASSVPLRRGIMEAFRNYVPSVVIAKLRPSVTVERAAAGVEVLRRRFRPKPYDDETPAVQLATPLRLTLVDRGGSALLMLMGSAALLLLIACANVTNLLLSRAATRQREIAVRAMLGATRGRVIRQLAVESLLLGFIGAAAALAVARASMGALNALLPPEIATIAPTSIDSRVLGFTLLVAVGASLIFGVWPAIGMTRASLIDATKIGGWGATARGRMLRGALVVVEVALALMLLVGAGLLLESLRRVFTAELGMNPEHIATARLSLPRAKYPRPADKSALVDAVLVQLRAAPNVSHAAAVSVLPMSDEQAISIQIVPEDTTHADRKIYTSYLIATPGYFATIGTRIVAGTDLPPVADSTQPVAVINSAMAAKLWPGENPVGQRFRLGDELRLVIGVVENIRNEKLDTAATAQMYFPMSQQPQTYVSILVRGTVDAGVLVARLRDAVRAVDPAQPIYSTRTLEDVVSASVAPRRMNAILLSVFGALALLIAAVGVYATLAYGVAQRTREIGVRMALGAQRGEVVRFVLREGAVVIGIGLAAGLAASYALGRVFESLVYEVSVRDPRVFVGAPAGLFVVALAATIVPALRAARVNPVVALREE